MKHLKISTQKGHVQRALLTSAEFLLNLQSEISTLPPGRTKMAPPFCQKYNNNKK